MRMLILSKRQFLLAVAILMSMFIGTIIGITVASNQALANSQRLLPIYCVKTDEKKVALTFDAAWGNSDTDKILDALKQYNAKATFFVTGEWADKYPEDVKKFYQAGHDIQNHSNKHPHVASIDKQSLIDDTKQCDDKIEKLIGKRPNLYRAPYGEYNDQMMGVFGANIGHKVIQWDVDSRDWKKEFTEQRIINGVVDNITSGSIILMHNDTTHTANALPKILETIHKKGYSCVLVQDILIKGEYYIDNKGTMCKAQ